ncbi:MAG: FAD-binding oxidoreductase [Peptoniphilus sp.]|nr:FAD-binding oxidoreductase [Peptoniphilus sp.]MDD7363240.1 FAD-binding oxidoreductase [Bacillota bacterium]MDY6045333.1 FAD-binding oxidoreductase [Peptoniphilus sp.]
MKILANKSLGGDLYKLTLAYDGDASPGQFFMLKPKDRSKLLGRPISVFSLKDGELSFLIKRIGGGTASIGELLRGDTIEVEGPFGNGFPALERKTLYIGGGTGIAPSLHLLERDSEKKLNVAIGLRERLPALEELYAAYGDRVRFYIGDNIFDELEVKDEDIFTCGPRGMMEEAVKRARGSVYVSLESRMGCGFGACLACTCEVEGERKRVCKDGPVFEGRGVYA